MRPFRLAYRADNAATEWHGGCCVYPGNQTDFDANEAAQVSQGSYWFHRQPDYRPAGEDLI